MLDHFAILAPFYEQLIKPKRPDQLLHLTKLPTTGLLLDVGGGTGRVTQFMVDQAQQVVLADLSVEMLQQASSKNGLISVGSASESLPFASGYFDRIIMVDALHHVYDQAQTASELWRVLKPGGRLVIEEPDLVKGAVKLVALAEKLALMRSHFLTPQEIAAMFASYDAGTQIERHGVISWVIIDKKT